MCEYGYAFNCLKIILHISKNSEISKSWDSGLEYLDKFNYQIESKQFPRFTVRRSGYTWSLEWDAALVPLHNTWCEEQFGNLETSKNKKNQRWSAATAGFYSTDTSLLGTKRQILFNIWREDMQNYLDSGARSRNSRYHFIAIFVERPFDQVSAGLRA